MSLTRKVFITVKTYPTLSTKYDELVCTAGILDDGSWIRIYPLPFRKLEFEDRYKKYQWVEVPLVKNDSDPRPESYKITDIDKVETGEFVDTSQGWMRRKKIMFENNVIYDDMSKLIELAKSNDLSLAIFKPTEILDLIVEETDREWGSDKLTLLKERAKQLSLFQSEEEVEKEFKFVEKLPYKFKYKFRDSKGKERNLMIEDWEIGALYWNCLKSCDGDESKALELVRKKYLTEFLDKDIYLFLGTTRQFHGWAKNPFVIIGVFYPPVDNQMSLI